ncbi:MAG: glycosyltransferase family 2 protein [Bacteroidota bacterium]
MKNSIHPIYSIVVPIYNDGNLAEEFCETIKPVLEKWLPGEDINSSVELIFVNDGSPDNSVDILKTLPARYPFVKVIELSRNFGHHIALSCGYKYAVGDYVAMLNVDMEDPPRYLPALVDYAIKNNLDIVYGLRKSRKGPVFEKITSRIWQIFLNKLTGNDFPLNTSTLRVMNRKFVNAYNELQEKTRYLPGLEMWLGFKKGFVETEHQARDKGKSSYNFRKRLSMAFEAIISFSDIPLRWTIFIGFVIAFVGFGLNVVLIYQKLFLKEFQAGYTSTVSIIVLFSGIQMMILGMVGLYIGRILREVQNRPLFFVRNRFNFQDPE